MIRTMLFLAATLASSGCMQMGDVLYKAAGKAGCDNLPSEQAIACRAEARRANDKARDARAGESRS